MQRLILTVAALIITAPATAHAVPIRVHEESVIQREVIDQEIVKGGDAFVTPKTVFVKRVEVDVVHVPPKDEDDDGVDDRKDDCVFCAPEPTQYASQATGYAAEESVASGTLEAIAACESGGDPTAVNEAGYYGKYQFDMGTWASVGGTGNPADASEAEQDERAQMLYDQAGSAPWPVCGG